MTSTTRAPFTTTKGVIHRVHRHATNMRTSSEPSCPTGFPNINMHMLEIRDLTDRRSAVHVHFP